MLYIVIPVFNRVDFTKACLNSLRDQTFKDFTTVIVDDGSTDGTGEVVKKEFPEVIYLSTSGNLFWTATTNVGIKYALEHGASYVMTLNNDTLATEDFLEKMMFWAKKESSALLGALALDAVTKKPVFGGRIISWKNHSIRYLLSELPDDRQNGLHKVNQFPGRGLLIPKEVFNRIGLFEEVQLPHYMADLDFTHQAIKNRYKVYCNYDAKILIYPEESGDRINRKARSVKGYINHLFGIKGGGNLKNFTIYARRNCPKRYFLQFLLIGYSKRILGYFMK